MKKTRHSFLKSQGYASINLKKTNTNHYQIQASVNNIKGIFILDTGASNTCADLTQETKISKKNKLQVGKWINKSSSLVLFDLNHINNALSERDIQKVDGIIGADTLKKGKAIIDYEKNRLYLKL